MNNKFYGSLCLILLLLAATPVTAQSADGGAASETAGKAVSGADTAKTNVMTKNDDGQAASADEGVSPLVLSPEEAFQRAYRHDLTQWQQSRGLELAEQKRRWRYLQLLPELEAAAVLSSFEQVPSQWQSDISASLSLTFDAASLVEAQSTNLNFEAVKKGIAAHRRELRAELYRNYYNLLLLQEELDLQKKQLESARARLTAAQYDFENGRISEYELLSAQLSVQEQEPKLDSAEIEYRNAVRLFKQNLGLPESKDVKLSAALQTVPFDVPDSNTIIGGLSDIPAIEAIRVQIEQQELNARMVNNRFFPQLSISLSRGVINNFQGEGFNDYDSARYAVSLSFTFNDLFPGSGYREARFNAETQIEFARRNLEESLQDSETVVKETVDKLRKANRDIEAAQLRLDLAERFYEIAKTEYENGRRDLIEVEEAEIQRGEARLNLLRAYYKRISLLITLNKYT